MNRVNPLHIGVLLCVVFIFVVFNLSKAKSELDEVKNSYRDTMKVATKLQALNEIYSDKQSVEKSLNRLLKQSSIKSAKIQKKIGTSSIVLVSKSINKTALTSLMAKVLNGSYNIVSLKIKRLSNKNASLEIEIKW